MIQLIKDYGKEAIMKTEILKEKTLSEYMTGARKARPATVIAVAQALGADWKRYV